MHGELNGRNGAQQAASLNIAGNATVGSMDVNGPVSLAAVAAPPAAPAGQGRIYFDTATNKPVTEKFVQAPVAEMTEKVSASVARFNAFRPS